MIAPLPVDLPHSSSGLELANPPQGYRDFTGDERKPVMYPIKKEPIKTPFGTAIERGALELARKPIGTANLKESARDNYKPMNVGVLHANLASTRQSKNRAVYMVLAFWLGIFGIHNFYAGHATKAVGQLLMTLASCGLLAGPVFIWNIYEIIFVNYDGEDRYMPTRIPYI